MTARPRLRLATRHWDHLIPIALGDVAADEFAIDLDRRDATPNLWAAHDLDGAETSFSGYVLRRAAGDTSVTALPIFVMAGFRQRCIITKRDSPLTSLVDLKGKRIGLTGWPDSGNTWTRALLRMEGVGLDEVVWRVGPLTPNHPVVDRIGAASTAGLDVAHTEDDGTLMGQLEDGTLDAVMTPFMPPGFFEPGSPWRTLQPDATAAEVHYFRQTGYVPGMHLLALRTSALEEHPEYAQALLDVCERSRKLAEERRLKLQDVYPWTNEALSLMFEGTGLDWLPYGASNIRKMTDDFVNEHLALGTLEEAVSFDELFPYPVDITIEN